MLIQLSRANLIYGIRKGNCKKFLIDPGFRKTRSTWNVLGLVEFQTSLLIICLLCVYWYLNSVLERSKTENRQKGLEHYSNFFSDPADKLQYGQASARQGRPN